MIYPIEIHIIPLNKEPYGYNKHSELVIHDKINLKSMTFKKIINNLNKILKKENYKPIHDFHYVQEDGDIAYIAPDFPNKILNGIFEDLLESIKSNYPNQPGYIIVNSEKN